MRKFKIPTCCTTMSKRILIFRFVTLKLTCIKRDRSYFLNKKNFFRSISYLEPEELTCLNLWELKFTFASVVLAIIIFSPAKYEFCRFFAICYPMKVKSMCTTRRAKIVILTLWIVSFSVSLPFGFTQVCEVDLGSTLKTIIREDNENTK